MSISKFVGRCTLLGLVVFLFVKGALVLRPRETVAALSALIAALVQACCGATSAPGPHRRTGLPSKNAESETL